MKCYVCETEPKVGGTHFHIREAVGVCHNCGIAICLEHSYKASEPGSPLLCPRCAEKLHDEAGQETSKLSFARHG
jgi:hypothetical protein